MGFTRIALTGIAVAATVVGCSGGGQTATQSSSSSSASPSTTSATTTAARTTTTTTPTTTATTTTTTTTTTTSVSETAIRSVEIEPVGLFCMDKVGADQYQLEPESNCSRGANFELEWDSRGENGDVDSEECAVVIDITGPNGLDERRRSGDCSGGARGYDNAVYIKHVPGAYTINISVTPPDGGAPVTATKTINILPFGS